MIVAPPSQRIVLIVQREIPSQNRRDRWHWRTRSADRDAWLILLRAAVLRPPVRPMGKMLVEIVSMRTRLIEDDANLRGGAKGCVDALVRLGFLRDDSDEFAHIRYRQMQAPRALRCTRISVEPA